MKHFFVLLAAVMMAAIACSSCDTVNIEEPGLLVPKTVDEDPSLPSIAVNGTQLHAESFGNPDDPMIVVLHGGPGGDYRSMLNYTRFVQDSFFVVFYDQRGSGLSKRHDKGAFRTQVFIDDLDAVIKHYRSRADQKVFLAGQSWGAMLATGYVDQHPADVAGVVMTEPGGFTWPVTKEYVEKARAFSIFSEAASDYVFLDQLITGSDHIKLDYKAALQNVAEFAPGNKLGLAGPYPFWRNGAVCAIAAREYVDDHPFDFTQHLSQYTTKVLFAYSERNEAYGPAHAQKVSSAYPNVQLVEIKGTGHEIPYFGWENFYPIASTYLKSLK